MLFLLFTQLKHHPLRKQLCCAGWFPLRYASSRRVTGDGTALGLARFFAPKETGKWWVKSDRLCQKFPTWYRGKTFCFSLEKAGAKKLRWRRDDGYSGTALIQ